MQINKKNGIVSSSYKLQLSYILLSFLIPLLLFLHTIKFDFTNWDDIGYVTENLKLAETGSEAFLQWLQPENWFVMGNFHPLTMLSLQADNLISPQNPKIFHLTNLLLHAFNTMLVFLLLQLLFSGRKEKKTLLIASFVGSLIFSLHPVNVESFVWVSERKNLLYTFFFVAALVFYTKYRLTKSYPYLVPSYLFFILSLLSKGQAVTLPLCFVLIDYFIEEEFNTKFISRKIPLFIISLAFGALAVFVQLKSEYIGALGDYNILQRVMLSVSSFWFYLQKLFSPAWLSVHYIFPFEPTDGIPFISYLQLIFVALLSWFVYFIRKSKSAVFAFLFFVVNLFFVLQIVGIGSSFANNRYLYIPSISLSILVVSIISEKNRYFTVFVFAAVLVFFGWKSHKETQKWKNSVTLWESAYNANNESQLVMVNLASAYGNAGAFDKSEDLLDIIVERYPVDYKAFVTLGGVKFHQGEINEALQAFNNAIKLNPDYAKAYLGRGVVYAESQMNIEALADFSMAEKFDRNNFEIQTNIAGIYFKLQEYEKAIFVSDKAISLNASAAMAFYIKGLSEHRLKLPTACDNLQKASELGISHADELILKYCGG